MAEAGSSDKFAQVKGFTVDISEPDGRPDGVDHTWVTANGGQLTIEFVENAVGNTFTVANPGHKTVGEITLRGPVTGRRAALFAWLNDTVSGRPWKRTVTITELLSVDGGVKEGKRYIYYDCFPSGYVFPRMSVTNTNGNVQEEVRIKPVRIEIK